MSIPTEAAPLPTPPKDEGTVSFGGGGHQTFRGTVKDGVVKGAVLKGWKRVTSTFDGQAKEQFCFLFAVPGQEADGELAYYTGVKVSTHPKSKLVPFLKTVGARVPTPQDPKLPDVVGLKADLFVKNDPSTADPSRTYPKIKEVMAAS